MSHFHFTLQGRLGKGSILLGLPMGFCLWYTLKIADMDRNGFLTIPGHPIFESSDICFVILCAGISILVIQTLALFLLNHESDGIPGTGRNWGFCAGLMFLYQLLFLLAFYPAPGMNDTFNMAKYSAEAIIQFPWFPSLLYGIGNQWSERLWGSGEPSFFLISVLQLVIYSLTLTKICFWIREHIDKRSGMLLYLYFLLCPIVGNYAIAAVRDGIFSLSILLWMWLIFIALERGQWGKKEYMLFIAASMGLMLLRSNGTAVSLCMTVLVCCFVRKWKKIMLTGLVCAAIAIIPGRIILGNMGLEPLFQEGVGVPLQQAGRVIATEGQMSQESRDFMNKLLPYDEWKKEYRPYTVDFVKGSPEFNRYRMNTSKQEFIENWISMGIQNPRTYIEGWFLETYTLWAVFPRGYSPQSRFGWAMTDENVNGMQSDDNDKLAVGDFPMPEPVKYFLAKFQYEGSVFFGSGFCLWATIILCFSFFVAHRERIIWTAAPLFINTATLLVSTPACFAFRYSFAYVLGIPFLLVLLLRGKRLIAQQVKN